MKLFNKCYLPLRGTPLDGYKKINALFMKTVFDYLLKISFSVGLCFYVVFNSMPVCAQHLVSKGLDSVETIFHIKYEIPKGFSNLNLLQMWTPNLPFMRGVLCWVFESEDKQCKVLYNVFPVYPVCSEFVSDEHRTHMYLDFRSMLKTNDFVLGNYLRILPAKEAQKRFNADSIFLYNVPTAIFDKDNTKFTHCTKMIITRKGRPKLDLVWYFTDKGKKKEKKYMQTINKHIWYNDGNWNWNWRRWDEWMITFFKELMDEYNIQIQ